MITGNSIEHNYEHYTVDSFCEIKSEYEVVFSYGNLTQEFEYTNDTAAAKAFDFNIKPYPGVLK